MRYGVYANAGTRCTVGGWRSVLNTVSSQLLSDVLDERAQNYARWVIAFDLNRSEFAFVVVGFATSRVAA